MIDYLKKLYFRYTLVTGIYVLNNFETAVVQSLLLISIYFIIRYTWTFSSELLKFFSNENIQEL